MLEELKGKYPSLDCRQGEAVFEAKKLGKTRCLDLTVKTTELVMQVLENHHNIKHSLIKYWLGLASGPQGEPGTGSSLQKCVCFYYIKSQNSQILGS